MSLIFENTYVTVPQNLAVTEELVGSVLAEDILSEKDKPELPSTNVDGYAVRCEPNFFSQYFEPLLVLII